MASIGQDKTLKFLKYTQLTDSSHGFSVDGDTTGHGWFQTISFELAAGSGAGSGWHNTPITLTRKVGSDTHSVINALGGSASLGDITLGLLDASQKSALSLKLGNARVVRYSQYVSDGALTEEVSLMYDSISATAGS